MEMDMKWHRFDLVPIQQARAIHGLRKREGGAGKSNDGAIYDFDSAYITQHDNIIGGLMQ